MRVCELHSFFGIELHSFEGRWAVDLLNRVESPLRGTEPSQKAIHQEGVLCSLTPDSSLSDKQYVPLSAAEVSWHSVHFMMLHPST